MFITSTIDVTITTTVTVTVMSSIHICVDIITVGFHNFNLRIFNLRVSNPNKFIVDVFLTRCRISMCQTLGPKNTMNFRKSTVLCGGMRPARAALVPKLLKLG